MTTSVNIPLLDEIGAMLANVTFGQYDRPHDKARPRCECFGTAPEHIRRLYLVRRDLQQREVLPQQRFNMLVAELTTKLQLTKSNDGISLNDLSQVIENLKKGEIEPILSEALALEKALVRPSALRTVVTRAYQTEIVVHFPQALTKKVTLDYDWVVYHDPQKSSRSSPVIRGNDLLALLRGRLQ